MLCTCASSCVAAKSMHTNTIITQTENICEVVLKFVVVNNYEQMNLLQSVSGRCAMVQQMPELLFEHDWYSLSR